MSVYAKYTSKQTSQLEPMPGREAEMVPNSAGGYVFQVDDWNRLRRFLILGSEGTYYATGPKLTAENAGLIRRCAAASAQTTVDTIVDVSQRGLAPSNDPALFALALVASHADPKVRAIALDALPKVARMGTHLLHFAQFCQQNRGWGRGLRRAIGSWYTSKTADDLAYQLAKYQSRDGWAQADLIRLTHPTPPTSAHNACFQWSLGKDIEGLSLPPSIAGFEQAKRATTANEIVKLIGEYRLTHEMIPTQFLTAPEVWEALLEHMPMMALVRSLARMTMVGLLTPMTEATRTVIARLADAEALKKSRIHPIALLIAERTYQAGKGARGTGAWTPVPRIVDALDSAFYKAFEYVEPTGQRFLLGVDVSGSMGYTTSPTCHLWACEVAAAMMMTTLRTETFCQPMAFSDEFRPLPVTPQMGLPAVLRETSVRSFGGTDCALPMLWAAEQNLPVDVFCVYTDNETWAGNMHPAQALERYRRTMGIPAKLVVLACTATSFSLADPNDRGMLDIAGFSADVPAVISGFARGEL